MSATTLEYVWVDGGQLTAQKPLTNSSQTSLEDMAFPLSRPTSPTPAPVIPHLNRSNTQSKLPDLFFSTRVRRASQQSRPLDKGKDPIRGEADILDVISNPSTSYGVSDRDTTTTTSSYHATTSMPSNYENSRPLTTDSSPSTHLGASGYKKHRTSLLVAASDALGIKFGRRRPSIRQPPMPIILPDVIEISAPRRDEEVEERERLKEMAAQSIGLGSVMVHHSLENSLEEEDEEDEQVEQDDPRFVGPSTLGGGDTRMVAEPLPTRTPYDSALSIVPAARYRSNSVLGHTRSNSATTSVLVPAFPSPLSSLSQFKQSASSIPKYYPPSSLRIFALSKNWKTRFMVLSHPSSSGSRSSGPASSFLHLFKTSHDDEKELERLEINEDSIVCVAEEEIGGRKHVIKIGGVDVGALKKELNTEEAGRTIWFLQIPDPAEAQKWISIIKTAILGQRSVRAGLGLPTNTHGGVEPRGDLDVMLSMRAQGLITSPTLRSLPNPLPSTSPQSDPNYASSISSRSVHSQATSPKATSGPVSTLKGFFSGSTRPRSGSRAASIESERQPLDRQNGEDSFGKMGSSLLNMLRSTPETPSNMSAPPRTVALPLPFHGPVGGSAENRLERRIAPERQPVQWSAEYVPNKDRANRTLSLGGSSSLQPPPRKRWTSITPTTTSQESDNKIYRHVNGNVSTAGSFGGVPSSSQERTRASLDGPISPTVSNFSFGSPDQRPRAPSLHSVSTYGSADNGVSIERSSSSTKRSSMKRWSTLPQRTTPPTGPPPAAPSSQSTPRVSAHPYAAERPPSRTSTGSIGSQQSVVSSLPSFSKRASGSSAMSFTASSSSTNSQSHLTNGHTRPISSHRMTMPPPPRPAPNFALPPAPDHAQQQTSNGNAKTSLEVPASTTTKTSFRDSVANRAFRLSIIAPKPPPSSVLPPRPDEVDSKLQQRFSTGSKRTRVGSEGTNASSEKLAVPPFPPPRGPLPPPPTGGAVGGSSVVSPTPSRNLLIKQRLRMLSAPSTSSSTLNRASTISGTPTQTQTMLTTTNSNSNNARSQQSGKRQSLTLRPRTNTTNGTSTTPTTPTMAMMASSSLSFIPNLNTPPTTPIAEKIMPFQNDHDFSTTSNSGSNNNNSGSFLQMNNTPITSPIPLPLHHHRHSSSFSSSGMNPSRPQSSQSLSQMLLLPQTHSRSPQLSSPSSMASTMGQMTNGSLQHPHQHQQDMLFIHSPIDDSSYPEMVTSLLPPPRRGSKQISLLDTTTTAATTMDSERPLSAMAEHRHHLHDHVEKKLTTATPNSMTPTSLLIADGSLGGGGGGGGGSGGGDQHSHSQPQPQPQPPRMLSLSRPGSVISLGIVSI